MKRKNEILQEFKLQRQKLGLSQAKMADHLNSCESAYRKIEAGTSSLNISRYFKICDFLNIDANLPEKDARSYEDILAEKERLDLAVSELRAEVWYMREQNMALMQTLRIKGSEKYFSSTTFTVKSENKT
jgi:transcriptional regulator with XRE-family HTH domain